MLKDPVLFTLNRINVDRHLLDQEVRQQMRVGAARLLAGRWVFFCRWRLFFFLAMVVIVVVVVGNGIEDLLLPLLSSCWGLDRGTAVDACIACTFDFLYQWCLRVSSCSL